MRVGLNLEQAGQELLISAPLEALACWCGRITEHAYQSRGALLVTSLYSDDPSVLARYQYAE